MTAFLLILFTGELITENSMYASWYLQAHRPVADGTEAGASFSSYSRIDTNEEAAFVKIHGRNYWWYRDWKLEFAGGTFEKTMNIFPPVDPDDLVGSNTPIDQYQISITIDPWSWQMPGPVVSSPKQNWPLDSAVWHTDGFSIEDVVADPVTGTIEIMHAVDGTITDTFSSTPVLQPEPTYFGTTPPHTLDSPPGFFSVVDPVGVEVAPDTLVFQHDGPAWTGTIGDAEFSLLLGQITSSAVPTASAPEPAAWMMLCMVLMAYLGTRFSKALTDWYHD